MIRESSLFKAYLHCDLLRNQIINAVFDFGLHCRYLHWLEKKKAWETMAIRLAFALSTQALYCRRFFLVKHTFWFFKLISD